MTTKAPQGARSQLPHTHSALSDIRLTAPGAALVVLAPTVLGGLLDGLFGVGYGILTALGFLAGCVFAVLKTRPRDLTPLMVMPPLLFVAGVGIAETLRSLGTDSWFRNEVVAITAALAGDALWVIAGTAAVAVIALGRVLSDRRHAHGPPLSSPRQPRQRSRTL